MSNICVPTNVNAPTGASLRQSFSELSASSVSSRAKVTNYLTKTAMDKFMNRVKDTNLLSKEALGKLEFFFNNVPEITPDTFKSAVLNAAQGDNRSGTRRLQTLMD